MKLQKVLLDVSHIIGWQGNLTGIERVEYHLIKYYYENTSAEFIYWNDKDKKFMLAERKFIETTIIERTSEAEQRSVANPKKISLLQRISRKLKRGAKSSSSNIPAGTVIILAGLWDNQAYIDGVKKLATAHHYLIHVVYDMIPLIHRNYVVDYLPSVYENYMYEILPVCKLLMAISESTARDTKRVLKSKGLNVPAITTFRLGDDVSRAINSIKPKGIKGEFILSVGTIEARKNHKLLYDVQSQAIKEKRFVPTIVIAGKRGWLTSELQADIDEDKLKGKVLILDKITDAELSWLYKNCLLTVFPSFYEGWGLPIAESLNYGKVTLASNTSSMPEVGGLFADYFKPTSSRALTELIDRYLDPKTRKNREAYIVKNYHSVNWETAAADFAQKANI